MVLHDHQANLHVHISVRCGAALLLALGRLHRALWINHRYWFTTWRWGRIVAVFLLIGMVLKLTMPA